MLTFFTHITIIVVDLVELKNRYIEVVAIDHQMFAFRNNTFLAKIFGTKKTLFSFEISHFYLFLPWLIVWLFDKNDDDIISFIIKLQISRYIRLKAVLIFASIL